MLRIKGSKQRCHSNSYTHCDRNYLKYQIHYGLCLFLSDNRHCLGIQ